MADGWRCPVCGRGVSPDQKTCDHGGNLNTITWWPTYVPPATLPATSDPLPAQPWIVCGSGDTRARSYVYENGELREVETPNA